MIFPIPVKGRGRHGFSSSSDLTLRKRLLLLVPSIKRRRTMKKIISVMFIFILGMIGSLTAALSAEAASATASKVSPLADFSLKGFASLNGGTTGGEGGQLL